jgi:hypothetical protein
MAEVLTLTGGAALLSTVPTRSPGHGTVSLLITAKALTTIDILLADCSHIDLADLASTTTHRYELQMIPTRVDNITGDAMVEIRGFGITDATGVSLALQLTIEDRSTQDVFVVDHRVGELQLSLNAPINRCRFGC